LGYVGRFAPSPTGPLHAGSLTTALASCLEARSHGGQWLLRVEDIDTPRCLPGATDDILRSLERLGFTWDGPVVYQSQRLGRYESALAILKRDHLCYPCGCTRRELAEADGASAYPGYCRPQPRGVEPYATRFRGDDAATECFDDQLQGQCTYPWPQLGDPVIRRRDQRFAYQLAVVVDDADAGVTHVVRGCDLLDSTPWQLALQRALGLPRPKYLHLPLVTNPDGSKLSKSVSAAALLPLEPAAALWQALRLLRQPLPATRQQPTVPELWRWATEHWQASLLHGVRELHSQRQES
jgi:glutamyl-Q tRNA(Asp) synthetase